MCSSDLVALGAIKSPGEMGADIVVGEGQSIGVGLQFGGPYVGLFGCKEKYVRQMPGRLTGETVDAEGKRGFVLTLSTREQHIRRADATGTGRGWGGEEEVGEDGRQGRVGEGRVEDMEAGERRSGGGKERGEEWELGRKRRRVGEEG